MKFIHAADIHLDSPLTGLSAYPDAPVEMLRTATRRAFTNLCDEAIDQKVDFLLIAGDLYDGSWKDFNTGIFFCKQMGRLKKVNIPVYILYGNHDAENEMTKTLQLPDNVFTFEARKCTTHLIPHLKVALHGRSFKDAATTENLVTSYPTPTDGMYNIGVLHTALEGNSAHPNYAPCTVGELHAKGYDYWALGHVHEYSVISGAATIVFPGNLQGRHVKESGPRGAVLVTVDGHGDCVLERLIVDVIRWHTLIVDVSSCVVLADVVRTVGLQLEALVATSPAHIPSAVRISINGRTAVHGELFGLARQLRTEILALAAATDPDSLWIEKVQINTSDLDHNENLSLRGDAVADLQTILDQAENDPEFVDALKADLMALITKAPIELQTSVSYFKEIRAGDVSRILAEVRPALVAYLAKAE
ncbi:metallophosphoesterase family protein [Glaciimonas immobilis]|uniref:DNA repair exonuclease SbcCD nuclease subunit n=1 Tax=Glaciimonas immobilis TaxID=728004 RepID=A0A840RTX4_9BURK|nr:DNA repair exonuclease [Glaciimonas immobilis]KAF3999690.1 DNA repair exonuclease [Glaciimonas immobilis]MBB5200134.1 DNA repair exonuclease SbcCD nuclease subunit [Glaciimonas immobilis]